MTDSHELLDFVKAMADAGTAAVLLPGAFLTLNETQQPPVAACRELGVPMAVATDCNPGTSPMTSVREAMALACRQVHQRNPTPCTRPCRMTARLDSPLFGCTAHLP